MRKKERIKAEILKEKAYKLYLMHLKDKRTATAVAYSTDW